MEGWKIQHNVFEGEMQLNSKEICIHNNIQIVTQIIPKGYTIYFNKSKDNVDFMYVQEGVIEIQDKEHKHILRAGDTITGIDVEKTITGQIREDVRVLCITTDKSNYEESVDTVEILYARLEEIQKKDAYTKGHCTRVCKYIENMEPYFRDTTINISRLILAAQLHDIGKCLVPDEILLKPGRFEPHEFDEMKKHTCHTYDLLDENPDIPKGVCKAAACHHERYDGTGYPYGLKGEEIPIEARLIAIVDTFDAMTTTRPYQKARTPEVALAEMEQFKHQFDPSLFELFKRLVEEKIVHPDQMPEDCKE
ncbi:MAG: HD-GYP domain-containing protein [Cellulosilyticaceae bacterium]